MTSDSHHAIPWWMIIHWRDSLKINPTNTLRGSSMFPWGWQNSSFQRTSSSKFRVSYLEAKRLFVSSSNFRIRSAAFSTMFVIVIAWLPPRRKQIHSTINIQQWRSPSYSVLDFWHNSRVLLYTAIAVLRARNPKTSNDSRARVELSDDDSLKRIQMRNKIVAITQ